MKLLIFSVLTFALNAFSSTDFKCNGRYFAWFGQGKLELVGSMLSSSEIASLKMNFNKENVFQSEDLYADAKYKPRSTEYKNHNRFYVPNADISKGFENASLTLLIPKTLSSATTFKIYLISQTSDGGSKNWVKCNLLK